MLLKANLIVYKCPINTYVYCPEIDFAESGELKKDAEFNFYKHYTQHLDHLACNGSLTKYLLDIGWRICDDKFNCPEYNYADAKRVLLERRLCKKELFHFTGEMLSICIIAPVYDNSNNYTDKCIPKFNRILS